MHFPTWVATIRPPKKQASARLRYMITKGAAEMPKAGSVAALAKASGIDRGLIYKYIDRGSFTESAARAIEVAVGRSILQWEHLHKPMEIENT
jgi:DNA invertase Pin-like site-specific DNA recombinase